MVRGEGLALLTGVCVYFLLNPPQSALACQSIMCLPTQFGSLWGLLGSEMLHNWQVPVQNDNAGLPVHNLWDLVQNGSVVQDIKCKLWCVLFLLCIFISCNSTFKCKYNLAVESLKWYNLYFLACTCICILFFPEEWKCCTKLSPVFLLCFLLDTRMFYQHFLSSAYCWVNKKDIQEEGIVCCPVFPPSFNVIISA